MKQIIGLIVMGTILTYMGFNVKKMIYDTTDAFGVEQSIVEDIEKALKNEDYEKAGKVLKNQIDKVVDPKVREKIYRMYIKMIKDLAETGKVSKKVVEDFILKLNIDEK